MGEGPEERSGGEGAPGLLRIVPRGVRRWMKRVTRPYADRVFEAYFEARVGEVARKAAERVSGGGAKKVSGATLRTLDGSGIGKDGAGPWLVSTDAIMRAPALTGKHKPVRDGQFNYVIARPVDPVLWEDGFPIPPPDVRVPGYGEDDEAYFRIAAENVERMRGVLERSGGDLSPTDRVLDFGCSCGPMMRSLAEFTERGEVWGVDTNGDAITWCMQHLSPRFRFALTSTYPHLPFEDGYFDLVYATSVFSHIGELADAWLLELARVVRPGGRVYLTIVTPQAMRRYLKNWPQMGFSRDIRERFSQAQIESDFLTLVMGRVPWQHAVYDERYFTEKASAMFEVVSSTPNAYSFQTALVLQRRDTKRDRLQAAEAQMEEGVG